MWECGDFTPWRQTRELANNCAKVQNQEREMGNSTNSKKRNPKILQKAVRPTVSVSGGQGAGGDKSQRAEKTQSQENAYKSRRLPAVRCTLC